MTIDVAEDAAAEVVVVVAAVDAPLVKEMEYNVTVAEEDHCCKLMAQIPLGNSEVVMGIKKVLTPLLLVETRYWLPATF